MDKTSKGQQGFTLIELMIVVGIIGVLAAMAVPNFLTYQGKAKQAEAKTSLAAIFTSAVAFQAETTSHTYAPAAIGLIGYQTSGQSRYSLWYAVDATVGGPGPGTPLTFAGAPAAVAGSCDTAVVPAVGAVVAASPMGFTAAAKGNIDGDIACDEWTINDQRLIVNSKNDVTATS